MGEIATDVTVGAVTARVDVPVINPDLAVIVADDVVSRALSHARVPPEEVTVALALSDDDHSTAPVRSRDVPLLKIPVAVIRLTVPLTSFGEGGSTLILVRFPPVTLRFDDPLTLPNVALMEVVPWASALATPAEIVALEVSDEPQLTKAVISGVVPSE